MQSKLFAQLPTAYQVEPGQRQDGDSQMALKVDHGPCSRLITGQSQEGHSQAALAMRPGPTGGRATGPQTPTVQINGALLPFADRLWFCAYRDRGPGQPAEPMGLYEITESLQLLRRAESASGIFSNRLMVSGVPGYLSIGPHLVGPDETIQGRYHKRGLMPWGEYLPGNMFFLYSGNGLDWLIFSRPETIHRL